MGFKTSTLIKTSLGLLCAGIFLFACKNKDVTIQSPTAWYPLKVGKFYIYNVDSVKYFNSTVQKPVTIHYQIKDSVISQFKDLAGNMAYKIEEFRRDNTTDAWSSVGVFTRNSNTVEADEVDGNNRVVKLVYPASVNTSWDANKYNTTDSTHGRNSVYTGVNESWTALGNKYDTTAVVQLQNDSTLINNYFGQERYAANIGLVYRQLIHVDYNTNGAGGDTAVAGFRYKQTLQNYGPR